VENLEAVDRIKRREKLTEAMTVNVPFELVCPGTHIRIIDVEITAPIKKRFQLPNPLGILLA
jgi:hypothetical protein